MALTKLNTYSLPDNAVTSAKIGVNVILAEDIASNAVTVAEIQDDAVTTAKIADSTGASDGVTTAKIATSAVTSAKIADDAITLAKMAAGTDGQIITYDASGNPVAVGPGTDGQVLTSTGAGSPPAFEDTAGGNTPQFYVYDENVTQSITSGTWTKVSFPDTLFDADNVFDSSTNHRFTVPSGQAGKYVLATRVSVYSGSNNITDARVKIYKNGSFYHGGYLFAYGSNIRHIAPHLNFIEDASAGDYYEVYIAVTATSPQIFADSENKKYQYFYGYKIG